MITRKTVISVVCLCAVVLTLAASKFSLNAESTQQNPVVLQIEDVYLPIIVKSGPNSDCGTIQNAINSLPSSGGQVIIASGTFTCTTAIVIDRDNLELRGQGHSTKLYLANGANSPVMVLGQTVPQPTTVRTNIRISDLSIDGNRAGQTQECWTGTCDTGGLTVIRNNGITLRRVTDVLIERVTVVNARSGGLVTEKGCQRVTVRDFTTSNNEFDGIAAYETENSVFTGLYLHDNPFAGLSLDIRFNNNIISDAVLTNNGKQGVFMRDSRDNLLSDIQIRGSGEQGLFIAQVDTDTTKPASGNTFSGLIVSGSAKAGMRVNNSSCINNLVVGAQFIGNKEGCISEETANLVQQIGTICRQ